MGRAAAPVVSIVGRPNVGKSTLFNRVLKRKLAVVDDAPGVTRDRHAALATWEDRRFWLVDTGGLLLDSDGIIETQVREQVEIALTESDVVLFMVDGRAGPLPDDYDIADLLRRRNAPVKLVVTKIDAPSLEVHAHEFAALGLGDLYMVSGLEGYGVGDLLDAVVANMPPVPETDTDASIGVAVVGRPNVGKSSIVNALLRESRMVVSETPGTTRDAIDTEFRFEGRSITLIDTAGLRRKARMDRGVEFYASLRATRSLARADVALVVLDASVPIGRQDFRIASMPFESGIPVVYVFNKWDLVEGKQTLTTRDVVREATRHVPDFAHAPAVFVSAKTKQRVSRLLTEAVAVYEAARTRVHDNELNALLDAAVEARSHPWVKGRMIKFWGMRQIGTAPPTFVVYVSRPDAVEENYRRFLKNRIRDRYPFRGCPIRLLFRRK